MDFILGAAIIVCPKHIQVPLLVGSTMLHGIRGWREKRRLKRIATSGNFLAEESKEVSLDWDRLECTLTDKEGKERKLLQNVQGSAKPGRLLAIMGPSGSGKTTLLNSLAGQLPQTKGMRLEGVVTVNGQPLGVAKVQSGFVQQEDIFYSQLSVRETLMMQAHLRLPQSLSQGEKEAYVGAIMNRLGLAKSADTVVGDAKTRGLSGGEKKRLSIACELIAKPMLVFADEPTTGLDSFQAEKVMQALKELTQDQHTVVVSIHQPRSSVFALFDDLVLLSEGEVVYSGPARDVLPYFKGLGYPCPQHFNPAEFLADLVALDHSSPEAGVESRTRLRRLVGAWRERQTGRRQLEVTAGGAGEGASGAPRCGLGRQVSLLFGRSWRQVIRDKPTNIGRAMSQVSSAVVFAAIYWRMGRSAASIQNRMGLLQVSAVGTAMTSLIKTLNVFPAERTIVNRERSRQGYRLLPYLLSKLAAELPIGAVFPALFAAVVYPSTGLHPSATRFSRFLGLLVLESFTAQGLGLAVGAAAPSTEAALALGPAVILVSIVFGGLFVNEANVPRALAWLPRTSLIKQAFEGMCINEFRGLEFEGEEGQAGGATGEQVLQRLSFMGDTVAGTALRQGRIMLFYWFLTYHILKANKPSYQKLLPPQPGNTPPTAGTDAHIDIGGSK